MSYHSASKTFTVSTAGQLTQAIADINAITQDGSLGAGAYTIDLTNSITLGTTAGGTYSDVNGNALSINGNPVGASNQIYAINEAASVSLTLNGNGATISGADLHNGLFVYAGTVTVNNLAIRDAVAAGGVGGAATCGGGGVGLGASNGLPAESYLDWGDRAFFTDGADHVLVNPDLAAPGLAARCRPVAVVDAERRRLDTMFEARLTTACVWPAREIPAWLP